MAKERATVAIVLYKSKTLADGKSPLMVRITKKRKVKYISLGISCDPKYWNFDRQEPKRNHPNKDVLNAILSKKKESYLNQILDYRQEDKDFTPDVLINKVEKEVKKVTVLDYFAETATRLIAEKRVGYARVFTDTRAEVRKFTNGNDLTFDQIDFNWLCKLETSLRIKDISDNAISVRMRTLRTLFNNAINNKYAKKEAYPFNEYKISNRFDSGTRKRAITKEDVKAIEALDLKPYSAIFEAQQYFLFSYYGQGINFIDIAFLKWGNIEAGRITYRRSKTGELITFKVTEPIGRILNYWKPFTGNLPTNYIFPILDGKKHITPTQQYDRTRKVLKRVNKSLKSIGEEIGLETPLTTYVARHTFGTTLKRANVSIAIISETMGHKSEAITKTYLKSFENSVIDQAIENL